MFRTTRNPVEFAVGWMLVAVLLLVLVPSACMTRDDTMARAACQSNFKELGQRLDMYATEHNDLYPSIQKQIGPECDQPNHSVMMFDGPSMYPDYIEDWHMLTCAELAETGKSDAEKHWVVDGEVNPCLFDNSSFFYFAWAIPESKTEVATGLSYVDGVERLLRAGSPAAYAANYEFIDIDGNTHTLHRLERRLDRKMALSAPALDRIPVMMDVFTSLAKTEHFNHSPGGSNVLYLDGHVDFLRYNPNEPVYPMTEAMGEFMALLQNEQEK